MTISLTLTDLLFLTGIVCLIVLTIYLVLALKALIALLNQSTKLVDESSKVVQEVQEKSRAIEGTIQELFANGQGFFKLFSSFKRTKKS